MDAARVTSVPATGRGARMIAHLARSHHSSPQPQCYHHRRQHHTLPSKLGAGRRRESSRKDSVRHSPLSMTSSHRGVASGVGPRSRSDKSPSHDVIPRGCCVWGRTVGHHAIQRYHPYDADGHGAAATRRADDRGLQRGLTHATYFEE